MLKALKSRVAHAIRLTRHAIKDLNTKRSSKWPKVEHEFLSSYPDCAACGGRERLNVHHKLPFHLHHELELDPKNLITLCMGKDKHCHLLIGHGDNFKAFVPEVEKMAAYVRQHPEAFSTVANKAKKTRLYS